MIRLRAKWLILLAVLLNVAGGPLAFAHSVMASEVPVAATQASGHCADHQAAQPADDSAPPAHGEPCCAGGHCACPAVSVFLATSAPAFVQYARALRADSLRLLEPPAVQPGDPLRPPIA